MRWNDRSIHSIIYVFCLACSLVIFPNKSFAKECDFEKVWSDYKALCSQQNEGFFSQEWTIKHKRCDYKKTVMNKDYFFLFGTIERKVVIRPTITKNEEYRLVTQVTLGDHNEWFFNSTQWLPKEQERLSINSRKCMMKIIGNTNFSTAAK
ncbi:MAG: hypothetical protein HQK84_08240 [Nitrospinae bacterium]|nr:hypothetical protein [Nitrospinota bacterium]